MKFGHLPDRVNKKNPGFMISKQKKIWFIGNEEIKITNYKNKANLKNIKNQNQDS